MTDEIDWPMTFGTLLLAAFLGWVVLAMYRPAATQAPTLRAAMHSANVTQQRAAAPAQTLPREASTR